MPFKYLAHIPTKLDYDWFFHAYEVLLQRLEALDGRSSAEAWLELVAHWNELKMVVRGERARLDWDESLDANDEGAAARARAFRGQVRPLATERNAQIRQAILSAPAAASAVKARYGAFLVDQWECEEIADNPVNIELDVADQELATRYHALRGQAQIEFRGETLTLTMLEKMLSASHDQAVRRGAFDVMMDWYRQNRDELDGIYLEMVALRDQAGRNLGFENFIPLGYKRMGRLDYGPQEVAQFRDQVLRHVTPLVRQLRAEQAQLIGTDRVMPWNRNFMSNYSLPEGISPPEKQFDGAAEIFRRLHPKLKAHFVHMVDSELIDLENRPGKQGGAFCTSMPDRSEVRIFCNSTGAASDVRTLLHESGHAFQSWESQWIEAVELRSPTLEACEIHSMGMEFLAYPHLSVFFDAENERKFKRGHLVEAMQFLCYACVVDGFQHQVYTHPGMDADQLADVWRELWDQYMVGEDWTGYDDELGTFWHHKLHIFSDPFYYIDYALAQLCAVQLWGLSVQDPDDALERYLHLCRLGGTHSLSDLVSLAGLDDPFAESTLLNALDAVRAELGVSS